MLEDQISWLLRNARTHAPDPSLRSAAAFAAGGGLATPVHRAQVGRWERGEVAFSHGLVRRYETVLGLPEGQLLCAVDYFARMTRPVRATATLPPPEEPDSRATMELLERALSTDRMSSLDWDHLSCSLGRTADALIRDVDWGSLIHRCTREMGVSRGLDFVQRGEAVARLVGHPRSGRIVAAMAAEVLADGSAQLYNDTVSLLQFTNHPAAVRALVGQLADPTNDDALRASLIALTSLLPGGYVGPVLTIEAARLAIGHLRDRSRPFRVHRGAANLLHALQLPRQRQLAHLLSKEDLAFAARIITQGQTRDQETLRRAERRINSALEGDGAAGMDAVRDELLQTALRNPNEESRSNALSILLISPQGAPVGRAYAAQLASACAVGDLLGAHECLTVLSWLTQPEDLDQFMSLACSPGAEPELVLEACLAIGNCIEPVGDSRMRRDAELAARARTLMAAVDVQLAPEQLRGLAYALGMRARFDLLGELAGDASRGEGLAAEAARGATAWWLDLPAHLRPLPEQSALCGATG